MKKIKKLSLFITLLSIPFLAVACESESHYKYEGNGDPSYSYSYTYTVPSGFTLTPINSNSTGYSPSISYPTTNPLVNEDMNNLYPEKIFDCYNDGYRLTQPIYFRAKEYTPSNFIVDTEMNIIQQGTNYYFGKAYALYLYDADKDGYRDFCIGYTEGDEGSTNDFVSILSLTKQDEIFHLSEAGLLNRGDYHFYADFSNDTRLYLNKDVLNSSLEKETIEKAVFGYSNANGISVAWSQTIPGSGGGHWGPVYTGTGTFVTPSHNSDNSITTYNVNARELYILNFGISGTLSKPAHEYFSVTYRTSDRFVKSVYYREQGNEIYLYLTFNDIPSKDSSYDIEVRNGVSCHRYKFVVDASQLPITVSRAVLGTTLTYTTIANYINSIEYSHEIYPFRDIYEWKTQGDILPRCMIYNLYAYELKASNYPSTFDRENISLDIGSVTGFSYSLDNKQFIQIGSSYYILSQPFDFLSFDSNAIPHLGFTTQTDIIARSIANPSVAIELENAYDIRFNKYKNNQYKKIHATYTITIGDDTFYVMNNTSFIDENEEYMYRTPIPGEDFSILFQ